MYIVCVYVHVKPEFIDMFRIATMENAHDSLSEPGIARFDFIQELNDPTKFMLLEVYFTPEYSQKHKETAHYTKWRDTVAVMMAEPRISIKYNNIFPNDNGW